MRITLAYPFEGHAPDETIELDDWLARRLLHGGRARVPDAEAAAPPATVALLTVPEIKALRRLNVDQLRAFAAENEIYLGDSQLKKEMLAVIEATPVRVPHDPAAG